MTTSSTQDTTSAAETSARPRSRRPKVTHLFWLREARAASEMGVSFPRLCGLWRPPLSAGYAQSPDLVAVVGGFVLPRSTTCKTCQRVLEAAMRRAEAQA